MRLGLGLGVSRRRLGATFDYYVDSVAGNDGNTGLSPATAWKTLAKVNAQSGLTGKRVGLATGGVWRETLTAPADAMCVGAYSVAGLVLEPLISGADLVSGWTSDNVATVGDQTTGGTDSRSAADIYYLKVTTGSQAGTLTALSLWVGTLGASGNINAALYADASGAPGAVVSGSVCTAKALVQNTSMTFTPTGSPALTASTVYWIAVQASANYTTSNTGGTTGALRFSAHTYDGTFPNSPTVSGSGTASTFHAALTMSVSGVANVWNVPLTNTPYWVVFNGTLGTVQTSKAALTAPGQWYWSGGVLSTYSTTSPDTAYTTVEASQRTNAVNGNAHASCTITGIAMTLTTAYGVQNTGANWSVTGCTITKLGGGGAGNGYAILFAGANCAASGNTIDTVNGSGIGTSGTTAPSLRATGNRISNCWNGLQYPNQIGMGVSITSDTALVTGNTVTGCSRGISVVGSKDSLVHHNTVIRQIVNGIDVEGGIANHPALVYNNTVWHRPTGTAGHGLVGQLSSVSAVFKNNLVYCDFTGTNTDVQCVSLETGQNDIAVDYNLYYLAAGSTASFGQLGSTKYATLAAWQAALAGTTYSGQDAHSLSADPLFTNAGANNYALQLGSPARSAGVSISGITDGYALDLGAVLRAV